ncbi:MAG: hypothetical protein L0Y56_15375, partial [Nitrospira sp.]|nr:hypothetical protein [Nitrospira sp.]
PFQPGGYLSEAEITDLAPTVLFLMGASIPNDMDGRVLESAFEARYLAQHPIRYHEVEPEGEALPDLLTYTAEEEAIIIERLEDLGYLG